METQKEEGYSKIIAGPDGSKTFWILMGIGLLVYIILFFGSGNSSFFGLLGMIVGGLAISKLIAFILLLIIKEKSEKRKKIIWAIVFLITPIITFSVMAVRKSPDTLPTSICTDFTYSPYDDCQLNGQRYRSVTSSLPIGCTGGIPATAGSCVYTPPKLNNLESDNSDVSLYVSAVGLISCNQSKGLVFGSGFLMDLGKEKSATGVQYNIFTNSHIIGDADKCWFEPEFKTAGGYPRISFENIQYWGHISKTSDFAIIPIREGLVGYKDINIDQWNWEIAHLPNCSPDIKVGSKVYTIGYPATGNQKEYYNGNEGKSIKYYEVIRMSQIVTEGIISGYSNGGFNPILKRNVPNLFVSNNVDQGNSGGAALAIEEDHFCMLGMPTWLNQGVSSNMGVVLSFYNFFN